MMLTYSRFSALKVDQALASEVGASRPATIVRLTEEHPALDLWQGVCTTGQGAHDDSLLLLPHGYEVLAPEENLQLMAELLYIGRARESSV